MISINTLILYFVLRASISTDAGLSKMESCDVEIYTELLPVQNCLTAPMYIETTRCDGQCYSEELLTDDWDAESTAQQHHRLVNCCSPNGTIQRQISVTCDDQQQRRIIQYPQITRCECKSCRGHC